MLYSAFDYSPKNRYFCQMIDISHTEEIYTVSRLNREVRFLLEGSFPMMWVEGEISNFAAPSSGHWYFSIKDSSAQIRCAMFKPQIRQIKILPKDGMHVLIKARVSLYEGRGDFQLLVEHLTETGEGKLRQEFELLKKRLLTAGLFAESHKKSLPTIPKSIGVITSATGAAIRDILSVLKRRFAHAPIIIYPTLVQGELSAVSIVTAIQTANRRRECDVLILARGGGSLEDLWGFNVEQVAHAIYGSEIPIISGIGHEVDFTIADFVADVRAPTPSAAAELIVPDKDDLLITLKHFKQQLIRIMQQPLKYYQQHLIWIKKNLQQQHPKRKLAEQAQKLDLCETTLSRLLAKLIFSRQSELRTLRAKLYGLSPAAKIQELQHRLTHLSKNLQVCMKQKLQHQRQQIGSLAAKLDALSPLSTLQRGFAIATSVPEQQILRDAKEIKLGDKIQVRLMEGKLQCLVEKIDFG